MRAVIQRVLWASVMVNDKLVGEIDDGLLILLGVTTDDTQADVVYIADKITGLRIFEDEESKMNRCITETGGSVLVISQFTLLGDCRKGRRPSFIDAARPEHARELYESFVAEVRGRGLPVETGEFQADMQVTLVNDGPVTILIDSKKQF